MKLIDWAILVVTIAAAALLLKWFREFRRITTEWRRQDRQIELRRIQEAANHPDVRPHLLTEEEITALAAENGKRRTHTKAAGA
jgi:hypothetical protein